ncbi:MAG: hypothetical protein B6241_03475 [Spirochaetaceae bacterium 4572_59]|nr:MAG: hypothetical protein B6241_03475 [Spirochaetaceae bacterium 4572_59]
MIRMNRLCTLIGILFLSSSGILFSQDIKNYALGFSESMFSNNLLWGFNRYVHQQDYGMISINSIEENLTNPWVWDQDEFIVNHLGHPYQGFVYYSAGRSAGNGFWTSATLSVMGSLSWELLMETETPSKNDLIITTFGGITTGKILFRLSESLLYGEDGSIENPGLFRRIAASFMSPFSGINEYFVSGKKTNSSEIKGYHSFGIGKSYFRVGENTFSETRDHSSGYDLNYIFLGASDIIFLKYKDLYLSPPDYERRSYSLCTGDNVKIGLTFSRKDRSFVDLQYYFYNFFIIDSSVPDGGSSGKELIGMASLSGRQLIDEDFFVGIRGSIYHKDSFYDDYMNLHERLMDLSLFYGITF